MASSEISELQAILYDVFEFSNEDIKANRIGKMSEAQKACIFKKHRANSRFAWVAFSTVFSIGFVGGSVDMIRTEKMGVEFLLMYLGVTMFFAVIVWAFIVYYRRQMETTLREENIQSVRGKIKIICVRGEKLMHWYFSVGHYRFQIERGDHRILLQQSGVVGREAEVYFSLPRQDLLSVVLQA